MADSHYDFGMGCDPPLLAIHGHPNHTWAFEILKNKKIKIWGLAFDFFKTIHGLSKMPMYKSYPPPTTTTTTTTTRVISRPAGLRPQVKIKQSKHFPYGWNPFVVPFAAPSASLLSKNAARLGRGRRFF